MIYIRRKSSFISKSGGHKTFLGDLNHILFSGNLIYTNQSKINEFYAANGAWLKVKVKVHQISIRIDLKQTF